MRVDNGNLNGAAGVPSGAGADRTEGSSPVERDHPHRTAPASFAGSGADRVELSALSRALHSSDSARTARVDRLSAQYRAGQYQVDPSRLSRSMIAEALQSSAHGDPR